MLLLPSSQVVPSGAALATISAAMLPPAPGRLSMITCRPRSSPSFWPSSRASMSLGPPGVKPTTKRTGLSGNALVWGCAQTAPAASSSAAAIAQPGRASRICLHIYRGPASIDHDAGIARDAAPAPRFGLQHFLGLGRGGVGRIDAELQQGFAHLLAVDGGIERSVQ